MKVPLWLTVPPYSEANFLIAPTHKNIKVEPRGLGREDAAAYIGISARKFDELVSDGRMPRPRRIDGRLVWDRRGLDAAFDELPVSGPGGTVLAPGLQPWGADD